MSLSTFFKYLSFLGCAAALVFAVSCSDEAAEETDTEIETEMETETSIDDCAPVSWPAPEVDAVIDTIQTAIDGQGDPADTYIGVMPNHLSGFWDIPELGFSEAKDEIGCLGDWIFPPSKTEPVETISQGQQDIFADWRAEGGDLPAAAGIGLSAKLSADLVAPINEAVLAGIPIVTFDSDVGESDRYLYIGPLNEPAGALAAKQMLDLLGADDTSKILVLAGAQGEANIQDRVAGIQGAFADAGRSSQLLDISWDTGDDPVTPIDAAYTADPDLGGIILLNGTWGAPVGDWLVAEDLTMQIDIVAWDADEAVLAYISENVIDATMVQREYFYGYLTTYVLFAMAALGVNETLELLGPYITGENHDLLNTGMDVITPVNAEYYSLYRKCLGLSTK
jgi:ribose transport system substrate-binding protein